MANRRMSEHRCSRLELSNDKVVASSGQSHMVVVMEIPMVIDRLAGEHVLGRAPDGKINLETRHHKYAEPIVRNGPPGVSMPVLRHGECFKKTDKELHAHVLGGAPTFHDNRELTARSGDPNYRFYYRDNTPALF
jgi:hypothetical protein